MKLTADLPRWAVPLMEPARYKLAEGGRGGGKSHFIAERLVVDSVRERGMLTVCIREVQRSLAQSSKRLIESKLAKFGLGEAQGFKVFKDVIETPGDGLMIFNGMQDHTAESIKSLEGFRRGWWEEAQNATAISFALYRPTLRDNAELWFSLNPREPPNAERPETSVSGFFGGHIANWDARREYVSKLPRGGVVVKCNFDDNPFLEPDSDLALEEAYDRTHRTPEDYEHIWRGGYALRTEARVFHNWRVQAFDTPAAGCTFRYGADFGFAIDPSVLVRCWVGLEDGTPNVTGKFLFVDYEAYAVGVEIDHTPALFGTVPGAGQWPITADSANPQSISYLKRNGFPQIKSAIKGPGSVEEGIEFLKAYTIIVHPRCVKTAQELTLYSFKTDPKTGLVLPVLADKENHVIDSLRYAVEDARRGRGFFA